MTADRRRLRLQGAGGRCRLRLRGAWVGAGGNKLTLQGQTAGEGLGMGKALVRAQGNSRNTEEEKRSETENEVQLGSPARRGTRLLWSQHPMAVCLLGAGPRVRGSSTWQRAGQRCQESRDSAWHQPSPQLACPRGTPELRAWGSGPCTRCLGEWEVGWRGQEQASRKQKGSRQTVSPPALKSH